ncbi:PPE family protein [Mycobacterium simiae]|uniref:PPE family protein n=1 Tax=Mycobacterium simiae TaxID=1784 RepID=A0A5B1BS57_MYCSI|nr:PPE family protein [Mycobacterium simiae]KAA1250084.1 PPE family protein [Mycobacterium simiae]
MDYAALPPEINSARMYAGAGAGPLLAAAAAWDGLSASLYTTSAQCWSVISGLVGGPWQGAVSAAMTAATAPYLAWLGIAAGQAEETAIQAKAAVAAYQAAFAMTVPPAEIAANRALLMALVATNVLGQNTPAIATTEAHYAMMWAQDAAAMYGYAGAAAAATRLIPFTVPPQVTRAAGLAVSQGAAAVAGTAAKLSQLIIGVPKLLKWFAVRPLVAGVVTVEEGMLTPIEVGAGGTSATMSITSVLRSFMSVGQAAAEAVAPLASAATNFGLKMPGLGRVGTVSASLGRAGSIGALSVPHSWGAAAPSVHHAATALPSPGLASTSMAAPDAAAPMLGGLPPLSSAAGEGSASAPRNGLRRRLIVVGSPAAG